MAKTNLDGARGDYGSQEQSSIPALEQYLPDSAGVDGHDNMAEALPSMHHSPKRRGRSIARWFGIFLVFFLGAALLYIGYLVVNVAKISTQPVTFNSLSSDASGRTNILVLGVGDPGHAGQNLSDTIMVLSLNTKTRRVAQISVPRDLRVDIPGYGQAKINAANADGGPELAEQTVSNTLGIPINYYVKTDFTGLSQIVDAVGGIDVDVTQELADPEYPCTNNQYKVCGLDIKPGEQHMDGALVLEYVRCRKGTCGNDFGRAARQQEVLNLVRKKVLTWQVLLNPVKLQTIVSAVRTNVETDLGAVQLAEFAYGWQQAQQDNPVQLVFSTAQGGYLTSATGSSDLLPIGGTFSAMQQKVQSILSPN
jgi:polyisoprenyl-teichoic acid--peptidoglycan teichoic acid transferase